MTVAILAVAIPLLTPNFTDASSLSPSLGARTSSARYLHEASTSLVAASSVLISGYDRAKDKTVDHFTVSLLSDGNAQTSLTFGDETLQTIESDNSEFYNANAAYWEDAEGYSATQAQSLAGQWVAEAPINAALDAQSLSIDSFRRTIVDLAGPLTKEPNRRLYGAKVADIHSAKDGDIYVALTGAHYPVAVNATEDGTHSFARFSGWNQQPEPIAPTADLSYPVNRSPSWSGYALLPLPDTVTQVDGSWIEPTTECPVAKTGYSSAWIGVGGLLEGNIFQVGTETDCFSGSQSDFAWFEEYPRLPKRIGMKILPGDSMSADIMEVAPNRWTYTLKDVTTGQVASSPTPIAFSGANNSVEWIEEDPGKISSGGASEPYATIGPVSFSGIEVNGQPPSLVRRNNGIDMFDNGILRETPSEFENDSFTVTPG
jgi:hypothetical protein